MGYVKKQHKCLLLVVLIILCRFYLFSKFFSHSTVSSLSQTNDNVTHNQFNLSSVEYVLSSNICLFNKPKVLILVTSHIQNEQARNIIRNSYPTDIFKKFNAQIVFLLAQKNKMIDATIAQKELHLFNDIVQGNFQEAYRNLTYKHYMGLKWTKDHCSSAKYIVKQDDDIVINYYMLFQIVNRFKSKFQLMGYVIDNMIPIRDKQNKWYVSEEEFNEEIYPAFLSGWLYIATSSAVHLILNYSETSKFFWIDDVFITGILRDKSEIKLTDIKQFFRNEPKEIECCILNKYSCDFIAAPNGKNYELNKKLNDHLWECRYKKLCSLETSKKKSCLFSNNFNISKGYLQTSRQI